jgi:hypothetical protein
MALPSTEVIDEFTADRLQRLIVLDDLMHRVVQNVDMELLFTQGCHHRRLSVVSMLSSSLYSLLSSYEFQHFSIVFLQVFQDVAEETVSISLSNEMNAVGSAGITVFRLNLVRRVKVSRSVVG